MSSASTSTAPKSKTVSGSSRAKKPRAAPQAKPAKPAIPVGSYRPLPTTPTVAALHRRLLENLAPYLEGWEAFRPFRHSSMSNGNGNKPAPPAPTSLPLPPQRKSPPKFHIPGRIWNNVIPGASSQGGKRSRAESDLAPEEQGKEVRAPKRQRRAVNPPEVGESSRVGATLSSRTQPPPKKCPRAPKTGLAGTPSANPYSRRNQYHTRYRREVAPVQTRSKGPAPRSAPTPTTTAAPTHPVPSFDAIPNLGIRGDREGAKAAWRRLFSELDCEMADYKGRPDAWHELMLFQADEPGRGWRARREDEPYVKKVLGFALDLERRKRARERHRAERRAVAMEEAEG